MHLHHILLVNICRPAKNWSITECMDSLIDTFDNHLGVLLLSIPDVKPKLTQPSRSEVIRFYRCTWKAASQCDHTEICHFLWSCFCSLSFRVEGLMERKRLRRSVVRDHLNNKFNLCFTVTSLHSSSCFFNTAATSLWLSSINTWLLQEFKYVQRQCWVFGF